MIAVTMGTALMVNVGAIQVNINNCEKLKISFKSISTQKCFKPAFSTILFKYIPFLGFYTLDCSQKTKNQAYIEKKEVIGLCVIEQACRDSVEVRVKYVQPFDHITCHIQYAKVFRYK